MALCHVCSSDDSFHKHMKNHVLSFGSTRYGALGNGESKLQKEPRMLDFSSLGRTLVTWTQVCAADSHSMVLNDQGELYCFGRKCLGEHESDYVLPQKIELEGELSGARVEQMSSRFGHTMMLIEGKLYGFGDNSHGELGDGTMLEQSKPVAVNMTGILDEKTMMHVETGDGYTVAMDTDGILYSWGNNAHNQLGNGDTKSSNEPLLVVSTAFTGKIVFLSASSHIIALDDKGRAFCWGHNPHGECALGEETKLNSVPIPTAVNTKGTLRDRVLISASAGGYHSVFVDTLGHVFVSGFNQDGQLGLPGSIQDVSSALLLPMTEEIHVVKVAAGYDFTIILSKNGDLYGFGNNNDATLGIGVDSPSLRSPVAIRSRALSKLRIAGVSAGKRHVLLIAENGQVLGMGDRDYLIPSDGFQRATPFQVPLGGSIVNDTTSQISRVATHSDRTIVVQQKSESWKVWTFGRNSDGFELGTSSAQLYQDTPIVMNTTSLEGKSIRSIAMGYQHTVIVDSDGHVFTWGNSKKGALCNGATESKVSLPTRIPQSLALFGKEIVDVAAGRFHTLLRSSEGEVFACGSCNYGECGINSHSVQKPTLVDLKNLEGVTISQIAAGDSHSLAVDTNGRAYSFGLNTDGQLGLGEKSDHIIRSPTPIDASGDLEGAVIKSVSGGTTFSMILDAKGNVYTTGSGFYGELGLGEDLRKVTIATHVTGILEGRLIVEISCGSHHALALDDQGVVFGWGDNQYSQLAQLSSLSRKEVLPIQLDLPSRMQSISAGIDHSVVTSVLTCVDHWFGDVCDVTQCFDVDSNSDLVCSAQGSCIDYNKCMCNDDYTGSDCSSSVHFFKNYTAAIIITGVLGCLALLGCISVAIGIGLRFILKRWRGDESDALYMHQRLDDSASDAPAELLGELSDDDFPLLEERVDLVVNDDDKIHMLHSAESMELTTKRRLSSGSGKMETVFHRRRGGRSVQ